MTTIKVRRHGKPLLLKGAQKDAAVQILTFALHKTLAGNGKGQQPTVINHRHYCVCPAINTAATLLEHTTKDQRRRELYRETEMAISCRIEDMLGKYAYVTDWLMAYIGEDLRTSDPEAIAYRRRWVIQMRDQIAAGKPI